jgi:peptidoglycan/xylan/chitin deacetylase (PgdA/CDA1 family)
LASARAPLPPLDGKSLIAHVVINVEVWPFDQAMPRAILSAPHGRQPVPDVPNFSWVEYGLRCGLPRIIDLLARRGLPASVSFNAGVIESYPAAASAIRDAGWEFVGHGLTQRGLQAEDDEAAVITETLDRIEAFTGARPRGWLGPGLQETFATPDALLGAGVAYVLDWAADEVPTWLQAATGRLVALPYTLELNDSVLHAVEHNPSNAMWSRLVDTLTTLDAERGDQPRCVTLALHPHLMGVPHRAPYLERALDVLQARDDVVFVTGSRLADWFVDACG